MVRSRKSTCILNSWKLHKNVPLSMLLTRNKRYNKLLNLLVRNLSSKLKKLRNNRSPSKKIRIQLATQAQVERVMTMTIVMNLLIQAWIKSWTLFSSLTLSSGKWWTKTVWNLKMVLLFKVKRLSNSYWKPRRNLFR